MKPLVSIIIPTYNEERYIANCLISIQNQNYDNYEILVINNGSTDNTKDIVSLFRKVKLYSYTDEQGAGASKNFGVSKAKGEYILFIDADEVIGDDYISNLIKPIINKECDATIPYHLDGQFMDYIAFAPGIFRAISKNKFKGFDTSKGYADDRVDWKVHIKKIEVPLYHITVKTLKKSYFKGKWIGNSFLSNEKSSFGSRLVYKIGYALGLFRLMRETRK